MLKLQQAQCRPPAAADPDRPRAHLEGRVGEGDQELPRRAEDGQPVVGSGPFRLVEGTAGGSTYRFEANPDYWKRRAARRRGRLPGVQERRPGGAGPGQGRRGPRLRHHRAPGRVACRARRGSPRTTETRPVSRRSRSTPVRSTPKTGDPIGNPNPALLDAKFRHALGYAVDKDRIDQEAYQGAGLPGSTIIPPAYPDFHWEPPADEAFTFDLDKAGQLLDDAGYTMGADGLRTLPDGEPIGTLLLYGRTGVALLRSTRWTTSRSGWASWASSPRSRRSRTSQLTGMILEGDFDAFPGAGSSSPTPTRC